MTKKMLFIASVVLVFGTHNLTAADTTSFFGVQTHFGQFYRSDMDSVSMEAQLDLITAAGFRAIRDECYWADVEKNRGVYTFPQQVDDYVSAAVKRGLQVLLILNYNNPLYAPHAGSQITTDSNRAAFAKYCVETVKRYSPRGIKHYEIWNEPNLPMFWDPTPNASDYVKLVKEVFSAVKKIDTTVVLIGGATSPLEGQPAPNIPWTNYFSKIVQDSGLQYMDAISFHQYRVDKAPETWLNNDMQTILLLTGNKKPVWLTEVGYHTSSLWPYTSETMQADYIARLYLLGMSIPALKRISYYDFKNDGQTAANAEHNFGIVGFDLSPKPAYRAVHTLLNSIKGKQFKGLSNVQNSYTATFGELGERVFACWHSTSTMQRTLSVGTKAYYITERDGARKLIIGNDTSISITVSSSPRYVTQLSAVPSLKSFRMEPKSLKIDTSQSFLFFLKGEDSLANPADIAGSYAHWSVTGSIGTVDSLGRFRASSSGTGKVIVSYQGFSDTASISVFIPTGSFLMSDFTDSTQWSLSMSNLDSTETSFEITKEQSKSGETSGRLDYAFKHKSGLGLSSYRAFLQTSQLVPGSPDSLLIDVYGNGQPHRIEFRFKDLSGDYFSKTASDQPTSWSNVWRPVKIWMKGFGTAVDYPITLDRITVYTVASSLVVDSTYRGSIYLDDLRVKFNPSTDVSTPTVPPASFRLMQNYPNPFNPATIISYQIPGPHFVSLKIFNVLGNLVQTVVDRFQEPGSYSIRFPADGLSLASGIYFCRLTAGEYTAVRKMLYLK